MSNEESTVELSAGATYVPPPIDHTIARLRASKRKQVDRTYDDHIHAGRHWAAMVADYLTLKRWGSFKLYNKPFEDQLLTVPFMAEGSFWKSLPIQTFNPQPPEAAEYAKLGFIKGAMEIWGQVEDKI